VLYQCGTTKPSTGDAGLKTSGARFFEIPLQKASLSWGGALPFFEMLGVAKFIHAIDMTYISSPCMQLMEKCEPGIHMKGGSEEFKKHHQDMTSADGSVVFTDSFGTGFSDSKWDVEFMVSVDPGILNRAEWVSFVAAFFNEEAKATEVFSKIKSDYNQLKAKAMEIAADKTNEWGGRTPLVAWTDSQPETCADPKKM
jgi:iron complex transport system substrate-binding protein